MEAKTLLVDPSVLLVDPSVLLVNPSVSLVDPVVPPAKQYCSHCHKYPVKSWKIKYCVSCTQKLKRWLQETDEKLIHLDWYKRAP